MKKMRKIHLTESQLRTLVGEGELPYLSNIGKDEIPGNAYGTQVFANNIDKDAEEDVTITDNPASKRSKIRYGYLAGTRRNFEESLIKKKVFEDLDNEKSQGYGQAADNFVMNQAQNGGKMIKNMANRLQNGGTQLHTTEVALSRHEADKIEDPVAYARNGGDRMANILRNTAKRQRNTAKNTRQTDKNIANTTMQTPVNPINGVGKGHHSQGENGEQHIYFHN